MYQLRRHTRDSYGEITPSNSRCPARQSGYSGTAITARHSGWVDAADHVSRRCRMPPACRPKSRRRELMSRSRRRATATPPSSVLHGVRNFGWTVEKISAAARRGTWVQIRVYRTQHQVPTSGRKRTALDVLASTPLPRRRHPTATARPVDLAVGTISSGLSTPMISRCTTSEPMIPTACPWRCSGS